MDDEVITWTKPKDEEPRTEHSKYHFILFVTVCTVKLSWQHVVATMMKYYSLLLHLLMTITEILSRE